MQETQETRDKLANAITTLRNTGRGHEVDGLVTAYKAKYKTQADTGVAYNADQSALAQMKSRVAADQEAQNLKDEQMRMAIGDTATNVLGKIRDFGQGGTNAVTRTVGGIATLANSALGFTDNPAFVHGTASNKYMLGGVMDDEGAFKSKGVVGNIADVGVNLASLAVPASAGTKAANLMNKGLLATNTGRKLMQSGGIASKVVPYATEAIGQTAAGVAGTMAQEGGYKEGDFSAQLAGNIAVPVLGQFLGKGLKIATGTTFANKLNQEANSLTSNASKLLNTSEGQKFLSTKGIRNVNGVVNLDDVKTVAARELNTVKDKLMSLPVSVSKKAKIQNILATNQDDGAIATFVGNLAKKTNSAGAFDSMDTIDNINHYVDNVYKNGRMESAIKSLGQRADLPLNRIPIESIQQDFVNAIENSGLDADSMIAGRNMVKRFFNPTDLKRLSTGKISKLEFLDSIRRASNKKFKPDEIDASLVLGNQVRKIFDVMMDTVDNTKLDDIAMNEYKAIKLMNKYYADAQQAKEIAHAINNVNVGGRAGLTRMIGGIIATGGSYNPIAYAAGSIGADMLHSAANKALNQNIFKTGVNDILDYTGDNIRTLDELTKHLAPKSPFKGTVVEALTRKNIANPVQLALPAPVKKPVQSLRDELIGTLSKPR